MKDKTVLKKLSLMIDCGEVEEELREALDKAIDDGFYINYQSEYDGETLLHRFFHRCSFEKWDNDIDECRKSINWMLDRGADVNISDHRNWNVLMTACYWQISLLPEDIFTKIVSLTEDINQKGEGVKIEETPEYTALRLMANGLMHTGFKENPSCQNNTCFNNIKTLLDHGAGTEETLAKIYDDAHNNSDSPLFGNNSKEVKVKVYQTLMQFISTYLEQKNQLNTPNNAAWEYEL